MSHDHDHAQPHRHPPQPDEEDTSPAEYRRLETAVRELLLQKGLFTADEMRQVLERFDSQTPAIGPCLIPRTGADGVHRPLRARLGRARLSSSAATSGCG